MSRPRMAFVDFHRAFRAPAAAALLLLAGGPVLAESGAPSVWVPLAPAYGQSSGPVVLVPYGQNADLPAPGQAPQPWVPDYLVPGATAGALGPIRERLRSMPQHDDMSLVAQGLVGEAAQEPAPPSASLSDVLRDAAWRRDTAARLRAQPGFQPRF